MLGVGKACKRDVTGRTLRLQLTHDQAPEHQKLGLASGRGTVTETVPVPRRREGRVFGERRKADSVADEPLWSPRDLTERCRIDKSMTFDWNGAAVIRWR